VRSLRVKFKLALHCCVQSLFESFALHLTLAQILLRLLTVPLAEGHHEFEVEVLLVLFVFAGRAESRNDTNFAVRPMQGVVRLREECCRLFAEGRMSVRGLLLELLLENVAKLEQVGNA